LKQFSQISSLLDLRNHHLLFKEQCCILFLLRPLVSTASLPSTLRSRTVYRIVPPTLVLSDPLLPCLQQLHQLDAFFSITSTTSITMSEAPVHQTPAVDPAMVEPTTKVTETSTDAVPSTEAPVVDSTKAENEITPVGGVTALPSTTEAATEAEAAPVTEGILGYKGPGLIK